MSSSLKKISDLPSIAYISDEDTSPTMQDGITSKEEKYQVDFFISKHLYKTCIDRGGRQSVMIIGDSITEGVGASSYINSQSWIVGRSIMNSVKGNHRFDDGYQYHTVLNAENLLNTPGMTSDGVLVPSSLTRYRLSLGPGKSITITNRLASIYDISYDASLSSGGIEFYLNGDLIDTVTISGSGLKNTYPHQLSSFKTLSSSDIVQIKSTSGTVVICALHTWKLSSFGINCYISGFSGSAIQDYIGKETEIAYYLNSFNPSDRKLLIFTLGTNSIYSGIKAKTPQDVVVDYKSVIDSIKSLVPNLSIVVSIPPKAVETSWPVIIPGYTYLDYAKAIKNLCNDNNYGLIRHDLGILSTGDPAFFADGVHPNDEGHLAFAEVVCRGIGIELDSSMVSGSDEGTMAYFDGPVPYAFVDNSPGLSSSGFDFTVPTVKRTVSYVHSHDGTIVVDTMGSGEDLIASIVSAGHSGRWGCLSGAIGTPDPGRPWWVDYFGDYITGFLKAWDSSGEIWYNTLNGGIETGWIPATFKSSGEAGSVSLTDNSGATVDYILPLVTIGHEVWLELVVTGASGVYNIKTPTTGHWHHMWVYVKETSTPPSGFSGAGENVGLTSIGIVRQGTYRIIYKRYY